MSPRKGAFLSQDRLGRLREEKTPLPLQVSVGPNSEPRLSAALGSSFKEPRCAAVVLLARWRENKQLLVLLDLALMSETPPVSESRTWSKFPTSPKSDFADHLPFLVLPFVNVRMPATHCLDPQILAQFSQCSPGQRHAVHALVAAKLLKLRVKSRAHGS